jgi:hypothetical protein
LVTNGKAIFKRSFWCFRKRNFVSAKIIAIIRIYL